MAGKPLPVPEVIYLPPEQPSEDKLAEVYAILFKKIAEQKAFALKRDTL